MGIIKTFGYVLVSLFLVTIKVNINIKAKEYTKFRNTVLLIGVWDQRLNQSIKFWSLGSKAIWKLLITDVSKIALFLLNQDVFCIHVNAIG